MTGSQPIGVVQKLSVQENRKDAIKPDVAHEYSPVDGSDIYPKFVVLLKMILKKLLRLWKSIQSPG